MCELNCNELVKYTYFRGRVALFSILKALDIGKGDEVAMQAFTCVAVPEAVIKAGAKPIYIDIEDNGFNMDSADLSRKLTSNTRAIVIQHTYGIPANVSLIKEISERYSIPIIEDCCHTLSSTFSGKSVGTFGAASFYSFGRGKPLVIGIGGSAKANDDELNKALMQQYNVFISPSSLRRNRIKIQYFASRLLFRPSIYWKLRDLYDLLSLFKIIDGNYESDGNLDDYRLKMSLDRKRLLIKKLDRIDSHNNRALSITSQYRSRIVSNLIKHPEYPNNCYTVFSRYPLITDSKREILLKARKARIEVADWFATPVHPLKEAEWTKVFYEKSSCPRAERMSNLVVTLPVQENVTPRYIDRVIDFLNMFDEKNSDCF